MDTTTNPNDPRLAGLEIVGYTVDVEQLDSTGGVTDAFQAEWSVDALPVIFGDDAEVLVRDGVLIRTFATYAIISVFYGEPVEVPGI